MRDISSIHFDILRLDMIHPVISGNKFFKLRFYLENAIAEKRKGILTFGGAFSNHILATACVSKKAGLPSIGIIRGEEPDSWSDTLKDARDLGMKLIFTEREAFNKLKDGQASEIHNHFPDFSIIPEGGYGINGMLGASTIHDLIPKNKYNWILCACGTGTMMAGLLHASSNNENVMGIPVLKNYTEMEREIKQLLPFNGQGKEIILNHAYHFGGYAKKTAVLTDFMNAFYRSTGIPTDFIYTGKLMFAVCDLIRNGFFPDNSSILAIHSGGLQGNRSLKNGILGF